MFSRLFATVQRAFLAILEWIARHGRGFILANIVAQAGIIVTGGIVRLTGSGLGCSTWPQCEPGRFTPEFHPEQWFHPAVEFGNRLLTFVLVIVALGVAIAVWRNRPDLKWWGLVPGIGVIVQAVVGGITVLVDLHPLVVAPHLLLSTILVWFSVWLALTYRNAPRRAGRSVIWHQRLLALCVTAILVLGALTTGAGPHSGDIEATERLALDPALIARAHAVAVWAFLVVFALLVWRVRGDRSVGPRDEVRKAWLVLAVVTAAQGLIGYIQYFTGLPEAVVALHLVGIGVFAAAHAASHYLIRNR
ncbi:COX15/CtaA family protein [Demequina sp. B12]|uniref:COX15/CtaA family protein n=1 Tax=Demequina sp. B12 TaxID=2992757 RepID=UPI00237A7F27|nr:COX15/CtaA family protein [Demequina sp. B12]MDE0573241.1 COX15/CtaA family protein [Demequina sp. B12]